MKKLILIIALLTISLYPQSKLLLLMGDEGYKNAETKTYLASLTTPISKDYATTLDKFISMVKDSLTITSLSQAFDVMYDLGGETTEQSLKNLVKRSHDATAVNSPTWTQWEGFRGNGTSSYLNTNYIPSTDKVVYDSISASIGYYNRILTTDESDAYSGVIVSSTAGISLYYNGLTLQSQGRLNSNWIDPFFTISAGLLILTKTSDVVGYRVLNGIATSYVRTTIGIPNKTLYINALNNNGTMDYAHKTQISFYFVGKGLSATQAIKLTNCVEWLMDSKGKGVIP